MKLPTAQIRQKIASVDCWYHQIEIVPGVVTPGSHPSARVLQLLQLPFDCQGLRVLDIGARDGFFSFEMERRGAQVLAIDHVAPDRTGFAIAAELLGSRVPFETVNLYDLNAARHGRFDIVLFLGVLYHLRNPLLALDRIRDLCRGRMWLESHIIADPSPDPIARFYPRDELNHDYSNWWGPNLSCLKAMVESCNFRVESQTSFDDRAIIRCTVNDNAEVEYYRSIERSIVP